MLAPSQMKLETVREPRTMSHSGMKASSLTRSSGWNVPSGSHTATRSVPGLAQAPLDGRAVALRGLDDLAGAGRGHLLGRASAALLLTTMTSSTSARASNRLTQSAMLSFSL